MAEQSDPIALVFRFRDALNDHDLNQLLSCFHPDYQSYQPAHPTRSFQGKEHLSENWIWVFERFPDFQAELVSYCTCGEDIWTEWLWFGADATGREIEVRGVIIFGVMDHLIGRGRLYLEPIGNEERD